MKSFIVLMLTFVAYGYINLTFPPPTSPYPLWVDVVRVFLHMIQAIAAWELGKIAANKR